MKLLCHRLCLLAGTLGLVLLLATGAVSASASRARAAVLLQTHWHIDCARPGTACTEVQDPEEVFGEGYYVGHDEPSVLFYSSLPGSGNHMTYLLRLPSDPAGLTAGGNKAFNFQLHITFWFGMALCDTQSYPLQVSTCTPDSDRNIVDPAVSPRHPGTAYMELQFYPPGFVPWPQGSSCDARRWCAALTIDSLSEDPVHGTVLNPTCAAQTGLEYVNFAFITRDGRSQAPANPVQATLATFTPDPQRDLFMNSGDLVLVKLGDTPHGLRVDLFDLTTGQHGAMTASAANGFGQVKFAPAPSTECTNIPYDFHPMYSTSSEATRVIWAAHSYNIAFADEIGHFDYCNGPIDEEGVCRGTEGTGGDIEPADRDDTACFPASASLRIQVAGCYGTNVGFDGTSYKPVWPDGNTRLHPTPILFSSPRTGLGDRQNYSRVAFEADTPRIEAADFNGQCNRDTGAGCAIVPNTDEGVPADFYPFFSLASHGPTCLWLIGNDVPGLTTNDFGKTAEFGSLLKLTYLVFGGGGATLQRYNDFRQVLPGNPCPLFF
ncbi:hypothetical protein [Thermogemmatispora sp.]|uniref:hypothetical protein n=1 Tax=Thermogemmatispora sp. TaxID=1968838 RepID=UPI0035E46043